jgi:hypothetical protein
MTDNVKELTPEIAPEASEQESGPAITVNVDEMFIEDFEFVMKMAAKRLSDPAETLKLFELFDRCLVTEVNYRRLKLAELGTLIRLVFKAINGAGKQGN